MRYEVVTTEGFNIGGPEARTGEVLVIDNEAYGLVVALFQVRGMWGNHANSFQVRMEETIAKAKRHARRLEGEFAPPLIPRSLAP